MLPCCCWCSVCMCVPFWVHQYFTFTVVWWNTFQNGQRDTQREAFRQYKLEWTGGQLAGNISEVKVVSLGAESAKCRVKSYRTCCKVNIDYLLDDKLIRWTRIFQTKRQEKKLSDSQPAIFNPFPCSHIVYLTVFIFLIITVPNNLLNEEKICETYNAIHSIRILKENLWSLPISHYFVVPGPWVIYCWVSTLTYISIYPQPWVLFMYLKAHSRHCYLIAAVFTSESLVCSQNVILIGRVHFELIQKRVLNPEMCLTALMCLLGRSLSTKDHF